jgi:hypothetical protein
MTESRASSLLGDNAHSWPCGTDGFPWDGTNPGRLAFTVGAVSMGALLPGDLGAVPDQEA